ncbi:MAG: hypothetical protein R2706_14005 [Acidimicrobiales bacterium]
MPSPSASDQAALELALRFNDSVVTVLSVGPEAADGGLRDSLAVGAASAVRLSCEGDDAQSVAAALSSVCASEADLVMCGDGGGRSSSVTSRRRSGGRGLTRRYRWRWERADCACTGVSIVAESPFTAPLPAVVSVDGSIARLRQGVLCPACWRR